MTSVALACRKIATTRQCQFARKLPDAITMSSRSESGNGERAAVAVDALRLSGSLRLQVGGASMLPALWPGDTVEIARCSLADVQPGEIILAFREGRFFLHRFLVRSGDSGFVARGDSMPNSDPVSPASALLGRVVQVVRSGHAAPFSFRLRPLDRALGMLFCYCGPARRAALRRHSRRLARGPDSGAFTESVHI
jgi:hypothetical protein